MYTFRDTAIVDLTFQQAECEGTAGGSKAASQLCAAIANSLINLKLN